MKKSGFTLLETMIAVVILAAALLLLANSWSGAFARVKKTQQSFEIASLLERKIIEVELEYKGKSLDEIPEEKSDDFGKDYPQYSWKMTSKKLEIPDLSAGLTAKEGGVDQLTLSLVKQLTEGLSKAIKEVTVTILFKPGKGKAIEHSVTTYFVDYDKSISFGMPTN